MPIADRLRPSSLDNVVGQLHILGPNRPLRKIIEAKTAPNMIFYGPPGTGKTTVAQIIAANSHMRLHKLNGTNIGLADMKQVFSEIGTIMAQNGILLYLDEIQYLNKKQQQSLLEYMEDGRITLIASTTENPYFYIYNAILSRATVFEFKPVPSEEMEKAILRCIRLIEEERNTAFTIENGAVSLIARRAGGDVRKALNIVEILTSVASEITAEDVQNLMQQGSVRYDMHGDEHYDLLSALQKSIRGSDPDAAVHYLARLLKAGDLLSPCRRLLVIASEDVGLAYPQAISIVKACVDSARELGLPEARIPLAQAAIFLATAPKSNSAYLAIEAAAKDLEEWSGERFPRALQNKHYDGTGNPVMGQDYHYPHDYPNHYIKQQYLPDSIKNSVYYQYGENKMESAAFNYWKKIKENAK